MNEKHLDEICGNILREARESAGLSLDRVAYLSGASRSQLQKYEKGTNRISVSRLFTLAEVYSTTPDVIIRRVQNEIIFSREGFDDYKRKK